MAKGAQMANVNPKANAVFLLQYFGFLHHPPAGEYTYLGTKNLRSPPIVID